MLERFTVGLKDIISGRWSPVKKKQTKHNKQTNKQTKKKQQQNLRK